MSAVDNLYFLTMSYNLTDITHSVVILVSIDIMGITPSCLASVLCKCIQKFPRAMERVSDDTFYTSPHFIGNSILVYGRKNSYFPFHCLLGVHWPLTILTLTIIIAPTYMFLLTIPDEIASMVMVSSSGGLLLGSFLFTAFSDPGIVFMSPNKKSDDIEAQELIPAPSRGAIAYAKLNNLSLNSNALTEYIPCGKCGIDRPPTAYHCYDCNACMEELDHHCVWTGKCIARKTLWGFYLFLFSFVLHFCVMVVVFILTVRKADGEGVIQFIFRLLRAYRNSVRPSLSTSEMHSSAVIASLQTAMAT